MATYANIRSKVQSTVYGILTADSNVNTLAKIIDGTPKSLSKNRGAMITVNTPTTSDGNWVFTNDRFDQNITLPITIYSRKESVTRDIADAVINSLKTTQSATRAEKIHKFRIKSTIMNPLELESGDIIYTYTVNVGYNFVG